MKKLLGRRDVKIILLLFFISIVMRLPDIYIQPCGLFMNGEEYFYARDIGVQNFPRIYEGVGSFQSLGLLYFFVIFFIPEALFLRLFSIIIFSAFISIVYILARKRFSERVSVLTAAFLLVSPIFWFSSWMIKQDVLFALFAFCSLFFYFFGMESRGNWNLFIGGIFALLAAMARPFGYFIPVVVIAYLILTRAEKRKFLFAMLSFIFIIIYFISINFALLQIYGGTESQWGIWNDPSVSYHWTLYLVFHAFYYTLLFSNSFFVNQFGIILGPAFLILLFNYVKGLLGRRKTYSVSVLAAAVALVSVPVLAGFSVAFVGLSPLHILFYVLGSIMLALLLLVALFSADKINRFLSIWVLVFFLTQILTNFAARYCMFFLPALMLMAFRMLCPMKNEKLKKCIIISSFIYLLVLGFSLNSFVANVPDLGYESEEYIRQNPIGGDRLIVEQFMQAGPKVLYINNYTETLAFYRNYRWINLIYVSDSLNETTKVILKERETEEIRESIRDIYEKSEYIITAEHGPWDSENYPIPLEEVFSINKTYFGPIIFKTPGMHWSYMRSLFDIEFRLTTDIRFVVYRNPNYSAG